MTALFNLFSIYVVSLHAMPPRVRLAVRLLWLSLAIGFVNGIILGVRRGDLPSIPTLVTVFGILILVYGWLIFKLGIGCNWARIALVVLNVVGLLTWIPQQVAIFQFSVFNGLLGLATGACQFTAIYFVFVRPGSDWFKKTKESHSGLA